MEKVARQNGCREIGRQEGRDSERNHKRGTGALQWDTMGKVGVTVQEKVVKG